MPDRSVPTESSTRRASGASLRIGHGYDLHRLEPLAPAGAGRPFVLAGVRFDHPCGPVGHSDGDALFHAIADALLGAAGLPDIGQLYPDSDPALENLDSRTIIESAAARIAAEGWRIVNVDATVVCERPKIAPRKTELVRSIAGALRIDVGQVNLKGKTHERVDAVGEGRAIEVHVVALLAAVDRDAGGGGGAPDA
ncbi:MAG TPA: 2-C-methyl-D-erythritol 2,4-cyclodiphosphate synthase [Phycisphaerales bacterium]|nr:2-C-methyl-D-erythritol 2,4-cyclodiphosphate synthase [Phycisphaerales bacterium]HMP37329.1 2-C-methyl-D-erythritol 2,4-cyclodiphosphate synthase [Phycisphaerales bacterium]